MKAGISTSTGHPSIHFGFLHWRQRLASSWANSGVYPKGTSLKFFALTFGSCSGIFCLGTFSFFSFSAIFIPFLSWCRCELIHGSLLIREVGPLPLHQLIIVHLVAVEFRTVHAAELRLSSPRHAAGPAHT